jgi:hypothetical protein
MNVKFEDGLLKTYHTDPGHIPSCIVVQSYLAKVLALILLRTGRATSISHCMALYKNSTTGIQVEPQYLALIGKCQRNQNGICV